jgi:hypothetical protein
MEGRCANVVSNTALLISPFPVLVNACHAFTFSQLQPIDRFNLLPIALLAFEIDLSALPLLNRFDLDQISIPGTVFPRCSKGKSDLFRDIAIKQIERESGMCNKS